MNMRRRIHAYEPLAPLTAVMYTFTFRTVFQLLFAADLLVNLYLIHAIYIYIYCDMTYIYPACKCVPHICT